VPGRAPGAFCNDASAPDFPAVTISSVDAQQRVGDGVIEDEACNSIQEGSEVEAVLPS